MQHWSQLATRNWRAKPVRVGGAVLAIALGTAAVVWVTCTFESVRQTVLDWADQFVGMSHITVESQVGKWGPISETILDTIEDIDDVKTATPLLQEHLDGDLVPQAAIDKKPIEEWKREESLDAIDANGIDPARESLVRKWNVRKGNGRMLQAGDGFKCVVERAYAEEKGVGVGDFLMLWGRSGDTPTAFEIVGLVERRRIARFQSPLVIVSLPALQQLASRPINVTTIDIVLTEKAAQDVRKARQKIQKALRRTPAGRMVNIATTSARLEQIQKAQQQQEMILVLLGSVAMLTALFIILSTLSMGMIERVSQLGLMRCVGVTAGQLATLVLFEVMPIGLVGVIVGVPLGLALALFGVWYAPDYIGEFAVSWKGIGLAVAAGLVTTLVAAILPMIASVTVSPLEASRPRARKPKKILLLFALVAAIGLLAVQHYVVVNHVMRTPEMVHFASLSVVLQYVSYALAAPVIVFVVGWFSVEAAARILWVQPKLMQDQVGHAVWRSAGISCGLMVGLSLIVGLVVFSESFKTGWQFPKHFPEAYLWSIYGQMRPANGDVDSALGKVDGIKEYTTCNAINVHVEERPLFMEAVYASVTWFMGVDPEQFFDMIRVDFVEGDQESAIELLKRGGYVVVAEDFSNSRNKHVPDWPGYDEELTPEQRANMSTVRVWHANRWYQFKVAAVISSPALDIAAGYFQANSEMRIAASGSVIGTNADMKYRFGVYGRSLALLNFDLPPEPAPEGWPPAADSPEALGLPEAYYNTNIPLDRRWERYRQDQVLNAACRKLRIDSRGAGTVAELKDTIDYELTRITRLLTAVPAIALVVAALGVANLMSANVSSRAKQLAIMRAVGATRGLILRLVIGEAVVLGIVGAGLGVVLGLHLAANTAVMTERMWGYNIEMKLPWPFIIIATVATIGLCVIAAIIPARNAARTNVVDALHVT